MREWPGTTPDDVIVSVATHAVDLPVPDFYLTLMVGARLVLVPATRRWTASSSPIG